MLTPPHSPQPTSASPASLPSTPPASLPSTTPPVALSSAVLNRATSTLTLCFSGPLDVRSVQSVAHYGIAVNNIILLAEAARLQGNDTIVIVLPCGSLALAQQVIVSWAGVLDAEGQPLQGRQEVLVS